MKFIIRQPALLHMIQITSKAVAVRTTKQILTGILIEAGDNQLTLTAYDMELGIQNKIQADEINALNVEMNGAIVLPARYLSEVIRKLPNTELSITVNNNYMTAIECGNVEFHLHGIDAAEFPSLPLFHSISNLEFTSNLLRDFIHMTAFATSTAEARPVLTGIHIEHTNGKLTFTGTDGLRLATRTGNFENFPEGQWAAVIPGKSLIELARILPEDQSITTMQLTESHSLFVVGNTYFYTRLIEGSYPDTSRIIPKATRTEINIDVETISRAIDRAALIARDRDNHMVRLELDGLKMTFSSSSPEIGNVSESVEANTKTGEDFKIAFNAKYVLDALNAFKSGEVIIRFNGSNQPFTIQKTESDNGLQLISPVLMR